MKRMLLVVFSVMLGFFIQNSYAIYENFLTTVSGKNTITVNAQGLLNSKVSFPALMEELSAKKIKVDSLVIDGIGPLDRDAVNRLTRFLFNTNAEDQLEKIVLRNNQLDKYGKRALLGALTVQDKLISLELDNNNIGPDSMSIKLIDSIIASSPNLTVVNLGGNNLGPEANAVLTALQNCKKLTALVLNGNNLGSGAVEAIIKIIESNPNLTVVNLNGNNFGPEATAVLGALVSCRLNSFRLTDNVFGSSEVWTMAVGTIVKIIASNPNLTAVDLSGNNLGPELAEIIAKIQKVNPSLNIILDGKNSPNSPTAMQLDASSRKNSRMDIGSLLNPQDEDCEPPKKKIEQQSVTLNHELPNLSPEQQEQAKQFLQTISERYIQVIRNAYNWQGDVLWGGDIELIQIAELYNLRITVYQNNNDGQVVELPLIGPRGGRHITLWYTGNHYENYFVTDHGQEHTTDMPSDNNCMFHAVLRAIHYLDHTEYDLSDLTEVARLRNEVADAYQQLITRINNGEQEERENAAGPTMPSVRVTLTHENHNPIYLAFARVFRATNQAELNDAIIDLPPGDLRDEAFNIRMGNGNISLSAYLSKQFSNVVRPILRFALPAMISYLYWGASKGL